MAKIINKKLFAGILALSAGCLLASCEPAEAVPSNYTDPIITTTDGGKIDFEDNILGTLYESIASNTNSKVVEKILKEIVETKFGTYEDISKAFDDFASFNKETVLKGNYFEGEDKSRKQNKFIDDVYARVSEALYNEINSSSYENELGKFSEEKMYNAHRQELYGLEELAKDSPVNKNEFFVTENFDKYDVFGLKPTSSNKLVGKYAKYIEKKILPSILKDKLVEDYIFRKNPLVLGRSYGVKVSYVKVSYDNDSFNGIHTLLKKYAKSNIETGEVNFEDVADALKGFTAFDANGIAPLQSGTASYNLLKNTYGDKLITLDPKYVDFDEKNDSPTYEWVEYQGQKLIKNDQSFFPDSKIGQLIESYNKACKAEKAGRFPTSKDKAELDKFTSEGKSKEYGLLQKLVALAKEDYTTTDNWFVKSNGAGELPSAFTDRLFNIKVSQDIDKIPEENLTDSEKPRIESDWETSYLRNIKGNKFLIAKATGIDKYSESNPYTYIYDDGASACWIAMVDEAVSPAKFNEKSETYLGLEKNYGTDKYRYEDTGRAIAKVLASKDNYVKDAYSEYLNEYKDVIFYDSSLYDYFKSEYPDLDIFDEE